MNGRKTVLVVDDDPGILHVLAKGLSNVLDMFDVLTASNGQEAVEILERQPVDVLVTDLVMPFMDGFALIAYLTNRGTTLPVVVLSGMAAHTMEARLSGYAGLRILHKPAGYQAVARCVLEEIERVERGQLRGIPLAGILQLVEAERRSCTVLVRSGRRRGRLHFESGTLLNAFSDDFGAEGEAAAFDILGWTDTAIEFAPLPTHVRRLVHTPLQLMLLDLAAMQDRIPHEPPAAARGGGTNAAAAVEDAGTDRAAAAAPEGAASGVAAPEVRPPDAEPVAAGGTRPPEGETVATEGMMATGDGETAANEVEAAVAADVDGGVDGPAAGRERPPLATPEDAARSIAAAQASDDASTPSAAAPTEAVPRRDGARPDDEPLGAPRGASVAMLEAAPPSPASAPRAASTSDHVDDVVAAMDRLTNRAREAEAALAAVASEVEAFREARRRYEAFQERRERQRRELEAFRDDVARLAREILGRVEGLFDTMTVEEPADSAGPSGPTP